jgi:hypothetical protein
MTTAVLDAIRTERDQARAAAIAIAEGENFNPDDPNFVDLQARAENLDRRAGTLAALMEQQQAADALDGRLANATRRRVDTDTQTREVSVGEAFVRSDAYTGYSFRGTSGRFYVDADEIQTRALPTGVADLIAAGYKGAPLRVDTTPPSAPTPLLDSMSSVTVSGNAIEYVAWTKVAGGPAKVAEKAPKPSVEFAPVVTPATLDTIAEYTQLTRQLLEDEAAARTSIENLMRFDILRAEEAEAAAVLAAAGAAIPDAVDPALLSAIRVAIATVQTAGYAPNAVLLNPADWAALDIAVMVESVAGPQRVATYWGLTPIPSVAQPVGTAVVGDFRSALTHYTRSQISLYITDSHADTFLSNVFTILAERRSKTVLIRPAALCEAKTA